MEWFNLEGEHTGEEMSYCMHRKHKLSAKNSHATWHLSDHLMRFCVKRKIRASGQQALRFKTKNNGENKLENYDCNQEKLRKDLAEMIVMHEYPLSIVDHLAFRWFVSGLNLDFEMISHRTLRNILKIFDDGKSTLKKAVQVNQGKVAITIDLWIASNQKVTWKSQHTLWTMIGSFKTVLWGIIAIYCMFIYVYLYAYLECH